MTSVAYVLVNAKIGTEEEVLESLRKIDNVVEATKVYGVYDVAAKVRGENYDEIRDIISEKIRRAENVSSTLTLPIMKGWKKDEKGNTIEIKP
jgi:DNA-binding Lrp family transcriptional regulator